MQGRNPARNLGTGIEPPLSFYIIGGGAYGS